MRQSQKNAKHGERRSGNGSAVYVAAADKIDGSTVHPLEILGSVDTIVDSVVHKMQNPKFKIQCGHRTYILNFSPSAVSWLSLPANNTEYINQTFVQNIHISIMCLPPFACKQYIQWSVSQTRHPLMLTSAPINPILRLYCRQCLSTVLWHKV